jgi:hypothetical protein
VTLVPESFREGQDMQHRYIKTPAGRHEALVHAQDLPRALRNLLLVINDSQPVEYWLSNVKGVNHADVERLLRDGFIAESVGCSQAEELSAGDASALDPSEWEWALAAIERAPQSALEQTLKSVAWPMLRGTRAYRFVQDVDSCEDVEELRLLARAFIGQLRGELGLASVRQVREVLVGGRVLPSKSGVMALPRVDAADSRNSVSSQFATSSMAPVNSSLQALEPAVVTPATTPAAEPTDGVDMAESYRLRRWPSARVLVQPGFARLASLLSTRTLNLQQLVLLGRVDVEVGLNFLQDMRQLGLLDVRSESGTPSTVGASLAGNRLDMIPLPRPPVRAGANTPRAAGSAPAVSFGLLGRLRERLGLR